MKKTINNLKLKDFLACLLLLFYKQLLKNKNMQILLGAHETIVKINSVSIKIDYIQNFIDTHFTNRVIKNNYILIPSSKENSLQRSFLLKWLYALYTKKTNTFIPKLKETLLNRQEKPIKILLAKKTIYSIKYVLINNETISITVLPQNKDIAFILNNYFSKMKAQSFSTHLNVKINTNKEKELLNKLIHSKQHISIPHLHLYKDDLLNFIKQKDVVEVDYSIQKARIILGSNTQDDTKSIKKRYKKLAMIYHPDRAHSQDKKTLLLYTEKFQNIIQAYKILLAEAS